MPTLEEIVFQAGRDALADQDSGVTGIRQRTGTLLAAHALVASFLGATTVKAKGLHGFSWAALVALLLGLVIAAVLLSNWDLRFAIDAPDFYSELYDEAVAEAETETLGWLVSAAYGYHNLRRANAKRVRIMGRLLTVLGILMVLQTLFWLVALRQNLTRWLLAPFHRIRSRPRLSRSGSKKAAAAQCPPRLGPTVGPVHDPGGNRAVGTSP